MKFNGRTMPDHFTPDEARAWAAQQSPPFRIRFRSKRARRLTFGRMPTICLRRTVYTEGETIRVESLIHEFAHVQQWRWWFWPAYLLENFRHNYTGNWYEHIARVYARVRLAEVLGWLADYRNPLTQQRP